MPKRGNVLEAVKFSETANIFTVKKNGKVKF